MIRLFAAFFAMALALGSAASFAEDVTVRVGHNRVTPAEVMVQAGDSVIFLNEDEMPGGHSLVADDGSFESPRSRRARAGRTLSRSPAPSAMRSSSTPPRRAR